MDPSPTRRSVFPHPAAHRVGVGLIALLLTSIAAVAEVKPDVFASEKFGYLLKTDFDQRKAEALIERLDGTAMKSRVLAPFGDEIANHPSAEKFWKETTLPQFCTQLRTLSSMHNLIPCRVALMDGARWLECILFGDGGSFRLVLLRLTESAGIIRISDFRFSGSIMEATRAMRHTLILIGLRPASVLEEEELLLCDLADQHALCLIDSFKLLAEQSYDRSFTRLLESSERMQQTPIWRELRNRLALLGSAKAQAHLQAAIDRGDEIEPFLRYAVHSQSGQPEQMLTDLDAVIVEYHGLGVLRALRASTLVARHRPAEAYAVATELLETNPLSGAAYAVAVAAAVQERHDDDAFALLQRWSAISTPAEIEKALLTDAALQKFVAAPRFEAWKKTVTPPAPQPAPTPAT